MVRGLYTAATGMTVQRNKMDVLTNNIVNAETPGFKSDSLVTTTFDEVMLSRINDPNISIIGSDTVGEYDFGAHVEELFTDFEGGLLEETGKYTDLALTGNGFFTVQTAGGQIRYTRSGNFTVSGDGYLVTRDGGFVMGQNGKIYVGTGKFAVSDTGEITGTTALPDTLQLVSFEDPGVLRKEGDNLYGVYGDAQPIAAADATVRQGVLEGSNVDMSGEMVDMISVYRKYEANQKIANMTDKTLGLTVNLGRIGG